MASNSLVTAGRRRAQAIRAAWPPGGPGFALLALVLVGVALRLIAIVSWWPVANTLDDGYERFAGSNPFENVVHPAGYSLILGALGAVTREIALPVLLQHLGGFVSALLLWGATRRITGSAWAGLLPAGIVLFDPDQIILEHAILSETWGILVTSIGLYAAVRSFDEPQPWWRWPLVTGAALGVAATIRTAGLLVIPVAVLALLLSRPVPFGCWRRWVAPVSATAAAGAVLFAFASTNAAFGGGFGIRSSPGWYLYGRAAQFADCNQFTPPPGSQVLCESEPASERRGAAHYWGLGFRLGSSAPGPRYFGPFGDNDQLLGEWAQRAILAQPRDYLASVWEYAQGYWYPGSPPSRLDSGVGLDPQLAFTDGYTDPQLAVIEPAVERMLENYYNSFSVHEYRPGLELLRGWQQVIRFGPVLVSITTLLTLVGLAAGTRRSRIGVLLFGVGGLAMLVPPALTANYVGRYMVPMAGPMMAAAAIAIFELWRGPIGRRWYAMRDRQAAKAAAGTGR
jgi:Dolichyl-phosphate-mannose-protein mannosyltransferase